MSKVNVAMSLIMAVSATGGVTLLHHGVANAATGVGAAEASIIQSAQVNEQNRLNFGQIIASPTAGVVTIDGLGNVTVTGGHQVMANSHALGRFNIVGQAGQAVTVALPTSGFKVRHSNGVDEMNVDLIAYNVPSTLVGGTGTFNVGGDLSVSGNQIPGIYIGNYTVTVTYS